MSTMLEDLTEVVRLFSVLPKEHRVSATMYADAVKAEIAASSFIRTHHATIAQNAENLEIVTSALELCAARKEKAEKRLKALEQAFAEFWAGHKPYEVEQVVTSIERRADEIMQETSNDLV